MTQNEKKSVCIIIGTAHGRDVAGKMSPDGSLREYAWSRDICGKLVKRLQEDGYRAIVDTEDINEIGLGNRVTIVNNYCGYFGSKNVLYASIHVNAQKSDGTWGSANGWQCHVANKASSNSKSLSSMLYEEVESRSIKCRRPKKGQDYWCNDYYVLKHSKCPAVLIESLFMDNKEDCKYLLSKEGKETLLDAYKTAIEKYVESIIIK